MADTTYRWSPQGNSGNRTIDTKKLSKYLLGGLAAALVLICVLTCFYTVDDKQQAVLTTFGKVTDITEPGLHFKLPFGIQQVHKVDVNVYQKIELGYTTNGNGSEVFKSDESTMITGDYNIVNVDFFVEYKIADPVQYLYSSNATSTDAVPPTNVVLFRGADCYDGDDYALELNGRQYSLQNVPDLDSYSADLFTPEPTATPEPKSDLQVALENRLQTFTDRSHPALDEIPSLEGQVYIAVFNSSELLETSDEAARAGADFYDVPAARLAASPEDADTVLLVYRDYTQVGYYSTGGIALRVYTYVAVIHGESEQRVLVAVNEPPEKITASVGNGGAGEYEPETALRLIAEKLAETP